MVEPPAEPSVFVGIFGVFIGSATTDDGVPGTPTGLLLPAKVEPPLAVEPLLVDPLLVDPLLVEPLLVEPLLVEPLLVEPLLVEPLLVDPPVELLPVLVCGAGGDGEAISSGTTGLFKGEGVKTFPSLTNCPEVDGAVDVGGDVVIAPPLVPALFADWPFTFTSLLKSLLSSGLTILD